MIYTFNFAVMPIRALISLLGTWNYDLNLRLLCLGVSDRTALLIWEQFLVETRFGSAYCADIDEFRQKRRRREALATLSKYIPPILYFRNSIFDELKKLMIKLGNLVDWTEFSYFYEFVFFVCRDNGQKNIPLCKAIAAWRLVLTGRFRLLNQWCDFVQSNHRHNISEDTWQQVLAFSRCVYENLEGYDPEGPWPVLIDDFVEHMYRVTGSNQGSEPCESEEHLPGLKVGPGLKRKAAGTGNCGVQNGKRKKGEICDCVEPSAVEGCLSRGFACLLSSRSCLHL